MRNAISYSQGREASAAANQSFRSKAADQEQAVFFIYTNWGRGYLIGGSVAFSDV